jgi:hypothetical protein
MATTVPNRHPVAITIPADYLEDVRAALIVEIGHDSNAIRTDQDADTPNGREDRAAAVRNLREDTQLLDQVLDASRDTRVTGERDALAHVLDATVRVISSRLVDQCEYSPIEMRAVLDLAGRLRWAAEESAGIDGRDGSEAVA